MRVTQSMLSNNMLRNISNNYERLAKLQEQVTTQKKFSKPSDNPAAAMMGMTYRTNLNKIGQYSTNIGEATSWAESTDSALSQAITTLQKVRELAVQASNGTYEEKQRASIAAEIGELKEHLISIGDTQLGGNYIFNGYDTNKRPSETIVQNTDSTQPGYSAPGSPFTGDVSSITDAGASATDTFTVDFASAFAGKADGDIASISIGGRVYSFAIGADHTASAANLASAIQADITANPGFYNNLEETGVTATGSSITFTANAVDSNISIGTFTTDDANNAAKVQGAILTDQNINIGAPSYGAGEIQIEVFDGIKIPLNTSGEVFGDALKTGGPIDALYNALMDENYPQSEITNLLSGIDDTIQSFLTVQAQVGAKQNRIDLMIDRLDTQEVIASRVLSDNEDVDMEKIIIEFTTQESVHSAALAVGSKIIQPSLIDFLR
ncbi:flagellar hook-associated protein FlgL [Peribacillus asahii]|uniref:flagellar hook-associated protein FlgL n=1 Tax=Peribacillus asahii TaxID=228899 RepID=UPI00207A33BB|nr:flagellar hook-associated protein FlgL [Peribacillus asahii]USK69977.1 flagellar hook-associated protein FlgL [Peribacillus asahii]